MLQTKALYNLLRLNAQEDPSIKAEGWALEDLRGVPIDQLWTKLATLGVPLDPDHFTRFADECDSPRNAG